MYHDFPPLPGMEDSLTRQLEHINRNYHVVSMTDIANCIRRGTVLPPNTVAVTVDDGGRDFLNASPIFKAHKVPATLYVVSGVLDKKAWFWWDEVEWMIKATGLREAVLHLRPERGIVSLDMKTPEMREQAITRTKEALKVMGEAERVEVLANIEHTLQVKLPVEPPPHMSPLNWQEVKHLASEGFEIGAHTVTHPDLARVQDPADLKYELGQCKRRLEEELKRPILHFCYPYGTFRHFTKDTVRAVSETPFETAVTAEWGLNSRDANPLTLRRIAMEPTTPEHYFKECLAGVHQQKSWPGRDPMHDE